MFSKKCSFCLYFHEKIMILDFLGYNGAIRFFLYAIFFLLLFLKMADLFYQLILIVYHFSDPKPCVSSWSLTVSVVLSPPDQSPACDHLHSQVLCDQPLILHLHNSHYLFTNMGPLYCTMYSTQYKLYSVSVTYTVSSIHVTRYTYNIYTNTVYSVRNQLLSHAHTLHY